MLSALGATARFFAHVVRDVVGTLRRRWIRFHRRLHGDPIVAVAVDVFPFTERKTGVGWYEWNLLAALDERDDGIEYNLYAHTFLAPDDPPAPAIPGSRTMRLRSHHVPPNLVLPVAPTLRLLRRVVAPLLRVLDGNDVIFAPNFFPHPDQLPFGRSTVATVHDLAFAVMPRMVAPDTLAHLRLHLPATLFHSEKLVAVSDSTAADLVEFLAVSKRRVHTVHEGLDPSFESTADSDSPLPQGINRRYLLFVSTLEPRKNVIGILRAFRLLVEWGYPGQLVLVGRWGWRTAEIRAELASSAVKDRVVQLDYLPREQLPRLYRDSDALLFPSWMEGFGLPILEAMACGTPVVTTGHSSMPEVAGPAAVYVDPASAHGIASAVASLLADPDHRQRLVDQGRKRATLFSWQRAAAATSQILRQAAGLNAIGSDEYRV